MSYSDKFAGTKEFIFNVHIGVYLQRNELFIEVCSLLHLNLIIFWLLFLFGLAQNDRGLEALPSCENSLAITFVSFAFQLNFPE
jgi:hypothetical protein